MIIRKIGKARGCMLSPTIIGGERSSCKERYITIKENTVMIPRTRKSLVFMGFGAPPREHRV